MGNEEGSKRRIGVKQVSRGFMGQQQRTQALEGRRDELRVECMILEDKLKAYQRSKRILTEQLSMAQHGCI